MGLIKKLFCHHVWKEVRYLHGDEINHHNGKRHEYICIRCGQYQWLDHALDCTKCKNITFNNGGQAECIREDNGKSCYTNNRCYWKEKVTLAEVGGYSETSGEDTVYGRNDKH